MYCQKTYDLGWMKVIEKHYPGNFGAPGKKRQKKEKQTPEDVQKHNEKLRIRKLQMLIAANFNEGDLHVTLTYRIRDAPDLEGSKGSLKAFLTKMRKEYRKHGYEFKWICVTEKTQNGTPHHHLLIEDKPGLNVTALVSRLWGNGRTFFSVLDPDMEYEEKKGDTGEDSPKEYYGLADYLQKKESKEEKGCRYSRSRNLIIPEPKVERIHRRRWVRQPKPEKGWYVSHLENGENPFTGYPYQRYVLRRLKKNGINDWSDHKRSKGCPKHVQEAPCRYGLHQREEAEEPGGRSGQRDRRKAGAGNIQDPGHTDSKYERRG